MQPPALLEYGWVVLIRPLPRHRAGGASLPAGTRCPVPAAVLKQSANVSDAAVLPPSSCSAVPAGAARCFPPQQEGVGVGSRSSNAEQRLCPGPQEVT